MFICPHFNGMTDPIAPTNNHAVAILLFRSAARPFILKGFIFTIRIETRR